MSKDDIAILRARDFLSALVLIALSLFFLWRTSFIPLWGENRAGVSGSDWYSSAAIVPLGIFSALLVLAIVLLVNSIRSGGAAYALSAAGIGWNRAEAHRFATLAIIFFFYIAALVPRVDFLISSGLVITALIHGYHGGHGRRMWGAALIVAIPGAYAFVGHFPRSAWNEHTDDWLTLVFWLAYMAYVLWSRRSSSLRFAIPAIAVIAPLILVLAMAFGFRQNVPNRGGLIFKQIEYQYFVNLKPLWSR